MSKNNIDWYKGLYEDLYKNHRYEGDTSFKFSMSMLFDNDSDGYIDVESFEDGVNLLDVGCSTGKFLQLVRDKLVKSNIKNKFNFFGIDVSETAINACNKLTDISGKVASVTELPFEDNFFDITHSADTFEHLKSEDRILALKEVNRVLKPNGIMFGNVSLCEETHTPFQDALEKWGIENCHLNPISAEEWIELFSETAFEDVWYDVQMRPDCKGEDCKGKHGYLGPEQFHRVKLNDGQMHLVSSRKKLHPLACCRAKAQGYTTGIGQCHIHFKFKNIKE